MNYEQLFLIMAGLEESIFHLIFVLTIHTIRFIVQNYLRKKKLTYIVNSAIYRHLSVNYETQELIGNELILIMN